MNKFLFKSNDSDLQKMLINKLDMLLAEQRHQRSDLGTLLRFATKLANEKELQKQVDEYFEEDKKLTLEDMAQDGNSSST